MPDFLFYNQLDSMDCGPTCLQMVAKHYGKSYTLQSLRSRSFITKSRVSMLGISDAAESIGFRTRGYRLTWEQLSKEVPLPCIVLGKLNINTERLMKTEELMSLKGGTLCVNCFNSNWDFVGSYYSAVGFSNEVYLEMCQAQYGGASIAFTRSLA